MRIAAAIFAGLISTSVLAQVSPLQAFLSMPWSLGIHLAQWMTKEDKKVFYVEVTADGASLEEARQQAFRMAVEQAVGVIVSSETEMDNQRIQRDEIITYASGYVSEYKLVDQMQRSNRIWVKMQVWVSSNHLRDRLLNRSRDTGRAEGGRVSEQISSFQHGRGQADRLLESVLRDYPQRAFNISMQYTRVVMDADRQAYLQIPFDIAWSPRYTVSLAEAIRSVNQRSDCGGWLNTWKDSCQRSRSRITVAGFTGYFDDDRAFDLMHQHMLISRPVIRIRIKDQSNKIAFQDCFDMPELSQTTYSPKPFVALGAGQVDIDTGRAPIATHISLPLANLPVKRLDRIEIEAVRQQQCRDQ